ncbi:MAG: ABC transporter substrate-binding protein [Betaproteobacteria bacterium]|nr:ABC transporter substrate-binding protein [Betaproteobacteria bacterium]
MNDSGKKSVQRRTVLKGIAAAGATAIFGGQAPAVLAQTRPLKIGALLSLSKVLAQSGEDNIKGMGLYFDEIGWEVAGRKIEIIREDDDINPQVGLQKVRKLVESDQVDFLCGPQASNVAFGIMSYMKTAKTFWVLSGAGVTALTWERIPHMFRTSISVYQLSRPIADYVYDNVAKEVLLTGTDFAGGRDVLAEFKAVFTKRGGKIIKEIYPPLGTNDFSAYLTDIRSINPPATYSFYGGTDAVRFVKQYDEFGLKGKIPITGFSSLFDNDTLPGQGRSALGGLSPNIYADTLDTPENKKFVAAHRAKHKDYPSLYTDYGYVAARVIADAVKATNGDTQNRERLSQAVAAVQFNAPRGPFRFDPVVHHPIQNVYIRQVAEVDGRITNKVIATIKDVRDPGVKGG